MSKLEVSIEYIEQQTIYGLWQKSNDRTISKDIAALSKQYYAEVAMPEGKVLPYFVLSKNYDKQSRDFELFIVTTGEKRYKGHRQRKVQTEGFFSRNASAKPRTIQWD